jgi:sugar transferase (PEP-CTERM/EpsH1 system associated)
MAAVVAFSLPMVPYAPRGLPLILDMVDVDSFKWEDYSKRRRPGFLYSLEAARLRRYEAQFAAAADATLLASKQEVDQLMRLAPASKARCMENGVDFDYFDPAAATTTPELKLRRFVAFVGTMDYFPNVEAASWFAKNVFPELRKADPSLEFFIVGNNPSRAVRQLERHPGVVVTGGVPDVRPYILAAQWVVAPLHVARGVQNKVLEALAMGKTVFATTQVCITFGDALPEGLIPCDTVPEYVACIQRHAGQPDKPDHDIRRSLRSRFDWSRNLTGLMSAVDGLTQSPAMTDRSALDA